MKGILRGLVATATALAATMPGVLAATAGPSSIAGPQVSAATEHLQNGTFATAVAPWWSTGNTPISIDGGRLKAVVPGGTADKWDAMLGHKSPAFPIHQNHRYTLSFDASATATRELRTTVQESIAPYPASLDKAFTVGPTVRRYAFAFTGSLETAQAELTFQLGGAAGFTVWLDNVSLVDNFGTAAGNPLQLTSGYYVDPQANPRRWVDDPANANHANRQAILNSIATKPMARWFGNWSGEIADAVQKFAGPADTADKLPILVPYNLPGRDACGGHSGGGAGTEAAYNTWIETFAAAIGSRPALVILEPDSLGDFQCMNAAQQAERTRMIQFALKQFKELAPNTWVYLDAANKGWGSIIGIDKMAERLASVGLANAHGFAVNVSNYYTTAESITYANAINGYLTTAKPFVVDTSRNGKGSLNGEWCNPANRKLGTPAQQGGGAEQLLWLKVPGDSDGKCGIAPTTEAGQFTPYLANSLITGAS
jgi:endoglucanase